MGVPEIVAMQNEGDDIAPPTGRKERIFCKAIRRAMRETQPEMRRLILFSAAYVRGLNYWSLSSQL
jgi:hypothetical protein